MAQSREIIVDRIASVGDTVRSASSLVVAAAISVIGVGLVAYWWKKRDPIVAQSPHDKKEDVVRPQGLKSMAHIRRSLGVADNLSCLRKHPSLDEAHISLSDSGDAITLEVDDSKTTDLSSQFSYRLGGRAS